MGVKKISATLLPVGNLDYFRCVLKSSNGSRDAFGISDATLTCFLLFFRTDMSI